MFPQVLSIVQVVFTRAQRAKALAIYGATIGLATILGPVTGGFLIDLNIAHSEWRTIFYINVPSACWRLVFGRCASPSPRCAMPPGSTCRARRW